MQCPKCKSHSVRLQNGAKVCGIQNCTYIDVHPISYDNDVMHYQGQQRRDNRFSTLFSNNLENGGIQLQKQANFDKTYKKGKKYITDFCYLLKLSQNICDIASARLLSILKVMNKKKENQQNEQKRKNILSIKNLAGYSIFSACFQKQNYFQDYNICKVLGLTFNEWKDLNKNMYRQLSEQLDFVPKIKAEHIIMRVCRRNNINRAQQNAMIQVCRRITQSGILDVRLNTIAAIAYWNICQYSTRYHNKFRLQDICKKHEEMLKEGKKISDIQKCFDITPENVKKVFRESISHNFVQRYLPEWEGRIPIIKQTQKLITDYFNDENEQENDK